MKVCVSVFKHSNTVEVLGLRPHAFINFLVFGKPDETLILVYEILHEQIKAKEFNASEILKQPLEEFASNSGNSWRANPSAQ